MEVQGITIKVPSIAGVYGFGSFFRGECYSDIDIVVVVDMQGRQLLDIYRFVSCEFIRVGKVIGEDFDLVFLTCEEFVGAPFRERENFFQLYKRIIC